MYAIRARGVEKSFKKFFFFCGKKALNGVNLRVKKGEIHGIIGENGSGKSTLTRILSKSLYKDKGEVFLFGNPIERAERGQVLRVGLFSLVSLELSALENLKFLLNASGEAFRVTEEISTLFDAFKIKGCFRNVSLKKLSSGKKQAVNLICAISLKREIVLLDEPFLYLDVRSIEVCIKEIKKAQKKGITFIIVSHNLEILSRICDSFSILHLGKDISSGSLREINQMNHFPKDTPLEESYMMVLQRAKK